MPQVSKLLAQDSKFFPQDSKSLLRVSKSLAQDSKLFPQDSNLFPQVRKSLPQDSKSLPQDLKLTPRVTKPCVVANVQSISLSIIPNFYRDHPSSNIPFKCTYTCGLLVTFRGHIFPITLHVQLLSHYGYHFSSFNSYSS